MRQEGNHKQALEVFGRAKAANPGPCVDVVESGGDPSGHGCARGGGSGLSRGDPATTGFRRSAAEAGFTGAVKQADKMKRGMGVSAKAKWGTAALALAIAFVKDLADQEVRTLRESTRRPGQSGCAWHRPG